MPRRTAAKRLHCANACLYILALRTLLKHGPRYRHATAARRDLSVCVYTFTRLRDNAWRIHATRITRLWYRAGRIAGVPMLIRFRAAQRWRAPHARPLPTPTGFTDGLTFACILHVGGQLAARGHGHERPRWRLPTPFVTAPTCDIC